MGQVILVTGGARSGKSTYAEELADQTSKNVGYIATSQCFDDEMAKRISLHREQRPNFWTTYEEPYEVSKLIKDIGNRHQVLLLDCLTLFVSNLMFKNEIPEKASTEFWEQLEVSILTEIKKIVNQAKEINATLIIVTNEIGSGIVPLEALSRCYRDIVGRANQIIAKVANNVYLVCSGIPVKIKGEKK